MILIASCLWVKEHLSGVPYLILENNRIQTLYMIERLDFKDTVRNKGFQEQKYVCASVLYKVVHQTYRCLLHYNWCILIIWQVPIPRLKKKLVSSIEGLKLFIKILQNQRKVLQRNYKIVCRIAWKNVGMLMHELWRTWHRSRTAVEGRLRESVRRGGKWRCERGKMDKRETSGYSFNLQKTDKNRWMCLGEMGKKYQWCKSIAELGLEAGISCHNSLSSYCSLIFCSHC